MLNILISSHRTVNLNGKFVQLPKNCDRARREAEFLRSEGLQHHSLITGFFTCKESYAIHLGNFSLGCCRFWLRLTAANTATHLPNSKKLLDTFYLNQKGLNWPKKHLTIPSLEKILIFAMLINKTFMYILRTQTPLSGFS